MTSQVCLVFFIYELTFVDYPLILIKYKVLNVTGVICRGFFGSG